MWALLLISAALLLFALPLAPALHELRRGTDVAPLPIDQEHARDVRHFARRFAALVEQRTRAGVLVAEGPLDLPRGSSSPREVYGRGDVRGGCDGRFRAVMAAGALSLGPRAVVLRWAHARSAHALADCLLLGRLSADEDLALEPGCRFTWVSAPTIVFGSAAVPGGAEREMERGRALRRGGATAEPPAAVLSAGRWLVQGDLEIPAGEVLRGDLVVAGGLVVHRGASVDGSIKAHGDVRLDPGAWVAGAVVSTRSICAVGRCALGGPIVSEREVRLGAGAVVGALGAPTTVTAPVIRIEPGVVAHGTVWAREDGVVSFATFVSA